MFGSRKEACRGSVAGEQGGRRLGRWEAVVSSELRVPSVLHTIWSTKAGNYLNDLCPFLMAEMLSPILMTEEGEEWK